MNRTNKTIRISLRAGERLYVNGAVLRVDRKTSIEFLNNVVFMLENHVLQEKDATTPLRRLYFVIQKLLIEPSSGFSTRQEYYRAHLELLGLYGDTPLAEGLARVRVLVNTGRNFEALKQIRMLYELEDDIIREMAAAERRSAAG